jgi:hypothetical protein
MDIKAIPRANWNLDRVMLRFWFEEFPKPMHGLHINPSDRGKIPVATIVEIELSSKCLVKERFHIHLRSRNGLVSLVGSISRGPNTIDDGLAIFGLLPTAGVRGLASNS